MTVLAHVARHGRWCLIAGLLAGFGLPGVANMIRPWLPELVAALLFLAALRIGPRMTLGDGATLRRTVATVLVYQLAAPLVVLAVALALGLASTPAVLALVLVLSAPPVTGSPSFTILMGRDPAVAMRLLLIGTALLPLTVLPVFMLLPAVPTVLGALGGTLRLLLVIVGTVGLAFALHGVLLRHNRAARQTALDGLSAILLGVIVIGLMSAVGPTLTDAPGLFAGWLAFAFAVNFGAQLLAHRLMPVGDEAAERTGTSVVAGNRNIALFLVALPPEVMGPLLVFIGCYQLPMYLTPILLARVLAPRLPEHRHA